MHRIGHSSRHLLGSLLLLAAVSRAATFTVGSPSGAGQACSHGTIQSAIAAAEASPGPDTIRLTRSLTYQPEANTIATDQSLTLEGGYATCTQTVADGQLTIVSGAGGVRAPVLVVDTRNGGHVGLRRLHLTGGDVDADGSGGGIRFVGNGILEIENSTISANVAGYGGGIHAHGSGSDAELVIGSDVLIVGNTARYDGGGVYASQIEMSMTAPDSVIFNNEATGVTSGPYTGGYGGGLYIRANTRPSYAYVGTGGPNGVGAIAGNRARYGGGVAIGGRSESDGDHSAAELHLFTVDPARRGRIIGNTASIGGGAVHARSFHGTFDGWVNATVRVWNADLEDNAAPQGAAVYLEGDEPLIGYATAALIQFNGHHGTASWPAQATPCIAGRHCGRIAGNQTWSGSQVTDGAIVFGRVLAVASIGQPYDGAQPIPTAGGIVVENNRGGRFADGDLALALRNALVSANQFSRQLVRGSAGHSLHMRDLTVAGNLIGAAHLIEASNQDVLIQRSLLWQPGLVMLDRSGGSLAVDHVMASEIASLGGFGGGGGDGWGSLLADPLFVDPEHGDYTLRAGSPAIDMAAAIPGDDRDVHDRPRDQDLPFTHADQGVRDLGAFERQSLLPMVLNGDFDFPDLRLWTHRAGERDATQNAAGSPGSGSWKLGTSGLTQARVDVGEQCIRLPGPGRYRLDGWGKGGTSTLNGRDHAVLAWEWRRNGTDACSAGAADAVGELTLGSGSEWGRPAQPAIVDVAPEDFGPYSSITLRLIAVDGNPVSVGGPINVWFDGITLDVTAWDDAIFADGFEQP